MLAGCWAPASLCAIGLALGFGLGGGAGTVASAPAPAATSTASASIGPFATSSDRLSVTGSGGPNLGASKSIGVLFEMYERVRKGVAETIWSYADATSGWYLTLDGNTNNLTLITAGGTTYTYTGGPVSAGLHCIWITVTAGSAIRISVDGQNASQLSATLTYTNGSASARNVIGGLNTAVNATGFPLTGGRVLGTAYIGAALSDANLQSYSNVVNQTERYLWPAAVTGHASAVSVWHATDWDGSSGTTTAGFGSAPTTWTKAGSVSKNTIKAEYIYTLTDAMFSDAAASTSQTYQNGGTYSLRNSFARVQFASASPTRIVVGVAADGAVLGSGTAWPNVALRVDGVPTGAQYGGAQANEAGLFRQVDFMPGTFQAGSAFELTDGLVMRTSFTGVARSAAGAQTIRVPTDAPITAITTPTAAANRLIVMGDSITEGSGLSNSGIAAWPMLVRADRTEVTSDGIGTGRAYELMKDSPSITATVARLTALCDGTSSNKLWFAYGINDWANTPAQTAANFGTSLGALMDAIHAALPSLTIYLQTPISRSSESANTNGDTLGAYRTQIATVQSTRSSYITLVDGTLMLPYVSAHSQLLADDTHPTNSGNAYMARYASTVLGYTMPYPWSNTKLMPASAFPYVWVADSAYTSGGTVTTWTAAKGGTSLTVVNSPSASNAWGASNKGQVVFVGALSQYAKADSLASLFAGTGKKFSAMIVQSLTSLGAGRQWFSIDHSTTGSFGFHDWGQSASNKGQSTRIGDSGTAITLTSAFTLDTNRLPYSAVFDGGALSLFNAGTVDTTVNHSSQQKDPVSCDQLTFMAFRGGGTPSLFTSGTVRLFALTDLEVDDTSRGIVAGFHLHEAA